MKRCQIQRLMSVLPCLHIVGQQNYHVTPTIDSDCGGITGIGKPEVVLHLGLTSLQGYIL